MRDLALVLSFSLILAGCGGGGDSGTGSVSVVPGAPSQVPTPAPSSTASPSINGLNTGEVKPTSDATFLAATMEMTTTSGSISDLTGRTTGGSTSDRSTTLDTPGFVGSYDPTTGYRLADTISSVAFGKAQLISDTTATDRSYPTVLFANLATPIEDYLALYKEVVTSSSILGSGTVTPKYGGIGGWQHSVVNAGSRRTRLNYFAFGPATPVSAMPRSGIVKFSLTGSGNYARDADLYFTTHLDTLTVDFGAGTVTGMIGPGGQNFYTGGFGGLYGVTLAGTIVGNAATGTTGSSVAVASGRYRLLFVGPNADEVIITHVGQDGRGTYVGSSVGVRNPYLL